MNDYVNSLTPYLVDIIEFLFLSSKILAATSKKLAPPPDVCHPLSLFLTPFSLSFTDVTLLLTFLTYASHEHVPTEVKGSVHDQFSICVCLFFL